MIEKQRDQRRKLVSKRCNITKSKYNCLHELGWRRQKKTEKRNQKNRNKPYTGDWSKPKSNVKWKTEST